MDKHKNSKIEELSKQLNQPIKRINHDGPVTIIEFENGETLPLYGGGAIVDGASNRVYCCSFCGHEGNSEKPVVSINESNNPLICQDCCCKVVQSFIENGIELEIDITQAFSKEMIENLVEKNEQEK